MSECSSARRNNVPHGVWLVGHTKHARGITTTTSAQHEIVGIRAGTLRVSKHPSVMQISLSRSVVVQLAAHALAAHALVRAVWPPRAVANRIETPSIVFL